MKNKTSLWTVSIKIDQAHTKEVENFLSPHALTLSVLAPPRKKDAKIEALYEVEPKLAKITSELAVLAILHGFKSPKVEIKKVGNLNWLKKVASDFPPLKLARWTVYGAAHKKAVKGRANALQIDAECAFGTGEHPTTKGCLVLLDKLLKKEKDIQNMLDMGCGSGILAMAYLQATHGQAVGVDLDPQSVTIARQNAAINKLDAFIRIGKSDGYKAPLVKKAAPYDLIMANIFANPLIELSGDLCVHLRPGGYAILAGLLTTQASKVLTAHRQKGLFLRERLVSGEWTIFLLQKAFKNGKRADPSKAHSSSRKASSSVSRRISRPAKRRVSK